VLSITVDKPTMIEPVYELEALDVVADEATELLDPAVGDTTVSGALPVCTTLPERLRDGTGLWGPRDGRADPEVCG